MAAKKQYYDITPLKKADAQINIAYGQKGNGKSYQVQKTCIDDFFDKGLQCIYMRRYQVDCKTRDVERYWLNIVSSGYLEKKSKGEYTEVIAYSGKMYFGHIGEKGKRIRDVEFGDYIDLNSYQHYASQAFPYAGNLILEEFITDEGYLDNEPKILLKFIDTIFRERTGKVWMMGNTISRVCPYFRDWGLKGIRTQEKGTIDIYTLTRESEDDSEQIVTKIAVERCDITNRKTSMIFGKASAHIINGDFDVKDMPVLNGNRGREFETLYQMALEHQDFRFILQLKVKIETGDLFLYVFDDYDHLRRTDRLLTHSFSFDSMVTRGFRDTVKAEKLMKQFLQEGRVCFSSVLIGNDFDTIMKEYGQF